MTENEGPTGRAKNCTVWAEYEAPETLTPTAKLCNGGNFAGAYYGPCASRFDCRVATTERKEEARRHLPVVTNRPVLSDATVRGFPSTRMPTTTPATPSGTSPFITALRGDPSPRTGAMPGYMPTPVIPPESYPVPMQAPFVHMGGTPPGISPVFLPAKGEGILERTMKNVVQGGIAQAGYHFMSMAQSVDWFRKE